MFFILSKVLIPLTRPLIWILLLCLAALIAKNAKRKKQFLISALVTLIVFTNPFLLNLFAQHWDINTDNQPYLKKYSSAIVLGGFISEGRNSQGYFNTNADRFLEGLKLFNTGIVSHILITGGNADIKPSGFREGDWAKRELKKMRVPDSCVFIENQSRNTFENAAFSKKILEQKHLPQPYILVTSAFHMRRSLYIFKKAGINVIPCSSNYIAGHEDVQFSDFMPEAGILGYWNLYLKEGIGLLVEHLKH